MYTIKTLIAVEANNQTDENAAYADYPSDSVLVIRTDLLPPLPPAPPTPLDLSTGTEIDPSNVLTATANNVTFSALTRNTSTYDYFDMGVDHFNGNFEIDFELKITATSASGSECAVINLANAINNQYAIQISGDYMQGIMCGKSSTANFVCVTECNAGTNYNSSFFTPAIGTNYYCTFTRDSSVGTYGAIYLKIYSDAAKTTLLATLSVTLHSIVNFRYFYPIQSVNSGAAMTISGIIANVATT